ncbi:PREDICTED: filaggrin [Chrysochloris asiatica]|uniref:Filaggrin n=1 Tax=Chrysochloris asiatica TaxID=185453 RepID=A0A9B0TDE9_CHRAS|nr:PREDICTED: filaggrin [Chrysochloris asiatica]
MSTLLDNIISIIDIFEHYSSKYMENDTLCEKELKELLETEFRPILKNPDDPDTVDVFMHILDIDHNKKVDFTEFSLMVFRLSQAYYDSTKRQKIETSDRKHTKHSHTEKNNQDGVKDVDSDEEKRRDTSHSKRHGRREEKSPIRTDRKKHGHTTKNKERSDGSSSSRHTEKKGKKQHHEKRGKSIRSSSIELEETRGEKRKNNNGRTMGGEDEYGYEEKGIESENCRHSSYVSSYAVMDQEASDSEGLSENSERKQLSHKSRKYEITPVQSRDRTKHSETHHKSDSTHGHSESNGRGRQGSAHGQSVDSSRHSRSHKEETDSHGQPRSSARGRHESPKGQSAERPRHSRSAHERSQSGATVGRHTGATAEQQLDIRKKRQKFNRTIGMNPSQLVDITFEAFNSREHKKSQAVTVFLKTTRGRDYEEDLAERA